ncbi:glycosyl hydrolase [Parapedobacter tibetensis]|uniref:glycosyl hydrolase n=1 Tax=Parapedobacter tibetensis TaxID=2972951 RepID=UPI00214DE50A|nr:glycosyl hydrolase [Parapedobacter tibetensis]
MNFKLLLCLFCFIPSSMLAQYATLPGHIVPDDQHIPTSASPWVFWYLMHASFSKAGITADLEAMKEVGIAGAYLAPIKGKTDPPLFEPVIETLTPEWWQLMQYTFEEAERLGIKIALLPNDGFATAGGPWITPELSMQKVVWTDTLVMGGLHKNMVLRRPEAHEGFYQDIRVYAYPVGDNYAKSTLNTPVQVSSSTGKDVQYLVEPNNTKTFGSNDPLWIQYRFDKPFACNRIKIEVNSSNTQANRLIVETSDDGIHYERIGRLTPPRSGWLDWDAGVTHTILPVTARYFRFVYDPEGTEPGSEDLDAAKWKPSLKLTGITLFETPKLHQFEGKSGMVWRVGPRTTEAQIPATAGIPLESIIDITDRLNADGSLDWNVPAGNWAIIRMGHTSTGHKNETAGAGKGLECDKFNPEAVKLQFNSWFMKAKEVAGLELATNVLSVFHVDSWECGSQNWSPVFRSEFIKRRGYDPLPYLPAMAGVPVERADVAESFLYDVRQTISELIADNFFTVLAELAHANSVIFTSEATAPVMTADGLIHFREVDVPMGEFWLRSPSHDKPNDILDAISSAHIYGKPVVQAEAFTQIRMEWDEHPGNIKTLQDRNYALGINNLVYHVYTHNPWMDRKPGMTLDGVGLYFQRDQTWWKPGKSWVDYAKRCHTLLQKGKPVRDIAVFIGEEYPRRAVLPDRLVSTLPGIFGAERVEKEVQRLKNEGNSIQKIAGVTTGANMAQAEQWINPLNGYAYDSVNPDALINGARVEQGKIVLPGGVAYSVLVLPRKHQMQPHPELMTAETATKLLQLIKEGAVVVLGERPEKVPGLANNAQHDAVVREVANTLFEGNFTKEVQDGKEVWVREIGKGKVIKGPYEASTFDVIGLERDFIVSEGGSYAKDMAWNHRIDHDEEIYFISNQQDQKRELHFSFRVKDKVPIIYDAVTGQTWMPVRWENEESRTSFDCMMHESQSLFVIFTTQEISLPQSRVVETKEILTPWKVLFSEQYGGPAQPVIFETLQDWSTHDDERITYYAGTACYQAAIKGKKARKNERVYLSLGEVANVAEVMVNGVNCGVVWTAPNRVDITQAWKSGKNSIEIRVTNTWANRLIGDQKLPADKRITETTAPYRLSGQLHKAGLFGPVEIVTEQQFMDTTKNKR